MALQGTALPAKQIVADDEIAYKKVTFWSRFRKHRLAITGFVVLAIIVLAAILAPWISPFDPTFIDTKYWLNGNPIPPCFINGALCHHHLLGSDEVGRDLLTRLFFGARISLQIGFYAVIMEVIIGTTLGAISGYYGGWIDYLIMRITDVFLCIPLLPLLLVITAIFVVKTPKASLSFIWIVLIIGVLSWAGVARLVRASFLSLREREFAEAARAVGDGDGRIIFRHLLPNAVAPIVVQATLDVANIIILESTLSFLGFGIQPPTASWGSMLANAQGVINSGWWVAIFPGLAILITVLAVNYIGDGLRDALDPNVR